MNHRSTTGLLAAFLLLISAISAWATDTIVVTSGFYHVDSGKRIIVINQPAEKINAVNPGVKNHLVLDQQYEFVQPPLAVSAALAYQVTRNNDTYTVYFTHLPIVHVDARLPIQDTPSVYAAFSLSDSTGTAVTSAMGIEIRGGFSQSYPKKSYELSFWNDTLGTTDRDVRLLGMRTDNKWNLQAMYNEPLRANSKVANELWQEIHQLYYQAQEPAAKSGIAMAYVELFVNNEYRGVYELTERTDKKQLKLKKYNNGIAGELYKGADWGGGVTFTAVPPIDNTSLLWGGFEYKEPAELTDWTSLHDFVDFVKNSPDSAFFNHYQQRFRLDNAVDYYLFLNLVRATDNIGKNLYIAKYKANEPYYYVPWDLDGVFGNDWQGLPVNITNDLLSNGFYDRLVNDCSATGFRPALSRRWAALRASVITASRIMGKFNANNQYLLSNNVYEREQRAWGAYQYDATQLAYTTTWLTNRLAFLDASFGQSCVALSNQTAKPGPEVSLYPNPARDYLQVEMAGATAGTYELCIRDAYGRTVLKVALRGAASKVAVGHLAPGLYVATVTSSNLSVTKKLVIN